MVILPTLRSKLKKVEGRLTWVIKHVEIVGKREAVVAKKATDSSSGGCGGEGCFPSLSILLSLFSSTSFPRPFFHPLIRQAMRVCNVCGREQ